MLFRSPYPYPPSLPLPLPARITYTHSSCCLRYGSPSPSASIPSSLNTYTTCLPATHISSFFHIPCSSFCFAHRSSFIVMSDAVYYLLSAVFCLLSAICCVLSFVYCLSVVVAYDQYVGRIQVQRDTGQAIPHHDAQGGCYTKC